jgi:hypothetical protein
VGKALGGLRGFEGLMGEVSADAQGELAGALVLVRVRGGQFVIETVEAP